MFMRQLRGLEGCRTTPHTNAPQRRRDRGERGKRSEGGAWGGCQVITAITRQGSVTVSHICPPLLSGDRRGGDPDLPVSTDCGHYRDCALQVIQGCTGLLCRKTKSQSLFPVNNDFNGVEARMASVKIQSYFAQLGLKLFTHLSV